MQQVLVQLNLVVQIMQVIQVLLQTQLRYVIVQVIYMQTFLEEQQHKHNTLT